MENGWIKLHRKLLDNPLRTKPSWAWLWVVLLLKANHEDTEFFFNGRKVLCKKGQLVTGRLELATEIGLSPSSVERALKHLEIEHQIGQQKTTKYRIITILNWDKYQIVDSKTDNKWTTNGQQKDTNKNVKNEENDKNISNTNSAVPPFVWEEYLKNMDDSKRVDIQLISYFFQRRGLRFDTKAEVEVAIRRHLRAARDVAKFGKEKVFKAMDECDWLEKKKGIKWTIDTCLKMLTK